MSLGPPNVAGDIPGMMGNTLQGMNVLTMMEALRQRQQEELMRRSQEAEQAAAAAQQSYQQAAAAPPPQAGPMDAFAPVLLGNIASVIAQDPSFRQRGQEQRRASQAELFKARQDNLTALRDVYSQKAQEAERAGDLEQTEKYRRQFELLSKNIDMLSQKQANAMSLEGLRHQNRLAEIEARAGATEKSREGDEQDILDAADSVVSGETQITDYPVYHRPKINAAIRQSGRKIIPKKARDTIQALNAATSVIDDLEQLSQKINTGKAGVGRLVTGAQKAAGAATQLDPDAANFLSARNGFLATISRATGERGVLTDQDVSRARGLLPKITDSKQVAQDKIARLRRFIATQQERTVSTYTTPSAGQSAPSVENGPIKVRDKNGKIWVIDKSELKEAIAHGWTRAQ